MTPTERALAAVLVAWDAWPGETMTGPCTDPDAAMIGIHETLFARGFVHPQTLTAKGAALVERYRAELRADHDRRDS